MTRWERAAFAFFAGFVVTLCVCAVLLLSGCAATSDYPHPGVGHHADAPLLLTMAGVLGFAGIGLMLWPGPALKRKGPR